jgi:predicted adenylyl cyclase CyaB
MAVETEIKIRVSPEDLEPIRSRLSQVGANQTWARQREVNFLFDSPDRKLQIAGCALRLRIYGDQAILTFKGKIQPDPLFKRRQELESRVSDAHEIQKILQALGMDICFEYSKFREIYECCIDEQQVDICLDETEAGTFVELEGSSESIQQLAREFGWTSDLFIKRSYIEMLSADPGGDPES